MGLPGKAALARSFDRQPGGLAPTLGVESVQDRQNLEVFGSSGSFFRSDDVAEIGNHDVDGVDPHSVSPRYKLLVSASDAAWLKREIELTVGADEIPSRRRSERPAIVVKLESRIHINCANESSEFLERRRQAGEILTK